MVLAHTRPALTAGDRALLARRTVRRRDAAPGRALAQARERAPFASRNGRDNLVEDGEPGLLMPLARFRGQVVEAVGLDEGDGETTIVVDPADATATTALPLAIRSSASVDRPRERSGSPRVSPPVTPSLPGAASAGSILRIAVAGPESLRRMLKAPSGFAVAPLRLGRTPAGVA